MKIELKERPKGNPVIIEGFPGFGFVATIAVEYLVDHLKLRSIGRMWSDELAPLAIVHGKRIIQPLEILYDEKNNLIILEALSGVHGLEWEIADALIFLYKKLQAKEIISIEGVGTASEDETLNAYYFTNDDARRKIFEEIKIAPMKEGIVLGVSGALMVKMNKDIKASFIFAETHSKLPDNKAAAKIIEVLDKYLHLNVDYKPLMSRASEIEGKIKDILSQSRNALTMKKIKDGVGLESAPYIG